jgi:hypothetical protein
MHHETALAVALSADNKAGTPAAAWVGRWKNQMDSFMELQVNGSDITGTYTSANSAQGDGGPITGALKGYVAGDLISFLVLWPGGSMTAWTGQLVHDDDAPCIETLWHLVTDVENAKEPDELWTSTLAGADAFRR